uniref:HAT C-terminal dimerisation domain-containing protein n=1 Tax=Aegilops tauschii subsp. strangulata TaxID=200361 RepID=A0A453FW87_AEGTS
SKSELEKYLAEDSEDPDKKIDILGWWKENSSRFPILANMARDILAIPITTVASESAFSTSGRILDDLRTSLTPFMVQALVCTQDWLRRSTDPVDIKENLEELEVL